MFYAQNVDMSTTPNVIAKCTAQESTVAQVTLFATETTHLQQRDGDTQQPIGQEQQKLAQHQHKAKSKLQQTHLTPLLATEQLSKFS